MLNYYNIIRNGGIFQSKNKKECSNVATTRKPSIAGTTEGVCVIMNNHVIHYFTNKF